MVCWCLSLFSFSSPNDGASSQQQDQRVEGRDSEREDATPVGREYLTGKNHRSGMTYDLVCCVCSYHFLGNEDHLQLRESCPFLSCYMDWRLCTHGCQHVVKLLWNIRNVISICSEKKINTAIGVHSVGAYVHVLPTSNSCHGQRSRSQRLTWLA